MSQIFRRKERDRSNRKWIRSIPIGLLILSSLSLTTIYTHWELSVLTGLLLALVSKGMRRSPFKKTD